VERPDRVHPGEPGTQTTTTTARQHGRRAPSRIVFLADAASVLNQRWLRYAADRGHEVHVITLDASDSPLEQVTQHIVGEWLPAATPRSMRMLAAIPQVRTLLRRLQPDLVHSHYAFGFGIWGAASGAHPLIVSAWGTDVMGEGAESGMHARILRWVFAQADAVCATGEQLAVATRRFTSHPVTVTPFGVDTDLFHPEDPLPDLTTEAGIADRPLRLGMVKRLDDNSGIEVLLRALALDDAPGLATLDVIGSMVEPGWPGLARELGLGDRVTFHGVLSPEELARHLRTWDIAVQPTRWVEGYGVSALEAAASGVPVVASRLGGLQEVVEDAVSGLLIPPNDALRLAQALSQLDSAPETRRRMGAAGRARVLGRYDQRAAEAAMDQVYDRMLEKV